MEPARFQNKWILDIQANTAQQRQGRRRGGKHPQNCGVTREFSLLLKERKKKDNHRLPARRTPHPGVPVHPIPTYYPSRHLRLLLLRRTLHHVLPSSSSPPTTDKRHLDPLVPEEKKKKKRNTCTQSDSTTLSISSPGNTAQTH
jgi:hypothetical protein